MIARLDIARPRVAIIGAGIAGLTCAHRLHESCDVTVFEAAAYAGGHTNTVPVELDGERHDVDTGFIVYNERNYPHFTRLLADLGVATQPTTMSFSVRCERTGIEYNGTSLNTLFAQRRNLIRPRFLGMIRDIVRFGREAPAVLAAPGDGETIAEYVVARRYGRAFIEHYLVPMGASIWSCPPGTFRSFPIRFVVEFLANHGMLDVAGRPTWRVIRGGSQTYVRAMIAPFADRVLLRTPVQRVVRDGAGVTIVTRTGSRRFDQVILACHSDQALRLLADPTPAERSVLGAIPYERNEAVLHTDASVLPRTPRAWAAWNYRIPCVERDAVAVTYNMNILQGIRSRHTFCLTLNDTARIDPARIIARFDYAHPVYRVGRADAQRRHAELIDANRTSYCGAYWGYGFHEDGVRSAIAVCRALSRVPA